MRKFLIMLILLFIISGFCFVVLSQEEQLPILDEVDSFVIDDVYGGEYHLNNNKIKILSFFYTNCPDICPLTMTDFKQLQEALKREGIFGTKVELVAISIDPEHDQPNVIKEYASSFDSDPTGWKWLVGTPGQTKTIAEDMQMQYKKLEGDFFSHSIRMYLIDQDNKIRALYDMANINKPVNKEQIIKDILYLTNG